MLLRKKYLVPGLLLTVGMALATCMPGQDDIFGSGAIVQVNQGAKWTAGRRAEWYTQDQGSRIMPLSWMSALDQRDGGGFLSDSLSRYGYLPNPDSETPNIPVGFTVAPAATGPSIGMTCSACHTRQIDVDGTAYRIDGGPAIVDFQAFLQDLDDAVAAVLATQEAFDIFAERVLGPGASDTAKSTLKLEVETWYLPYHTLIDGSLPDPAWGPSRLDAVSMIFNRLAGLDIGEGPTDMIKDNIEKATAPTRYPFLWNAAVQDRTQWPGFAENGNSIFALARNLGEVYGVFGEFHPVRQSGPFKLNRDYISNNSANFEGLRTVEELIWKIGPPRWPWQLDEALVAQGRQIYRRNSDQGGCTQCHGIRTGEVRSVFHRTWKTPILDEGTDARECSILTRMVKTGIMEGARIPGLGGPLGATEPAAKVLRASVVGAIIQNSLRFRFQAPTAATPGTEPVLPPEFAYLSGAFRGPGAPDSIAANASLMTARGSGCAYESRVLEGIWAAAPYLHNGSVPTLTELLKPASERVASFKIGPEYDIDTVGLAVEQSRFDYTLQTTDCSDVTSGNSRCGHEYGTTLSESEKAALLEYLKSL